MNIYRINETDLNNFYKNNKDIKQSKIILSDFLNKNKYISPTNNLRQKKINLILSLSSSDKNIIILIWLFVFITILIFILL